MNKSFINFRFAFIKKKSSVCKKKDRSILYFIAVVFVIGFSASCLKSIQYENITSYSKPCWSYDSKNLLYTSAGKLWLAEAPEFKPRVFYRGKEFKGNPICLSKHNLIAVQKADEVWIIDIQKRAVQNKIKINNKSNWLIDPWQQRIVFRDETCLWPAISSKNNLAEVKRSQDYFGRNELRINDKIVFSETGITWIFSPYGSPLSWSPDGSRLYFISAKSGWSKIYSINFDGSDLRQETYGDGDDREFTVLSNGTIIFVSNRLSRASWSLWMKTNKGDCKLLFDHGGFVKDVAVAHDEKSLAFQYSTPSEPFEIFIMNLLDKKIYQVTRANFKIKRGISSAEVINYRSKDRIIEAILYKPKMFTATGRYPAIIRVHGGPSMQSALAWNGLDHFLASNGYIVLAPNYTGSVGYGRIFEESNLNRIGYEDCEDIAEAANYLKKLPYIIGDAIGVMGSSYGGYITNLVIGKYPNIFSAAVSWYGISDWLTIFDFPKLHPIVKHFFLSRIGYKDKNYLLYKEASPLTYAESIKTPLLIAHGDDDIVVPIQQSELLYSKMRSLNKNVVIIKYSGQAHGWTSKKAKNDAYKRMIKWFNRYLKGQYKIDKR